MPFIPSTEKELYDKMRDENFKGEIKLEDDWLVWRLPNNIVLKAVIDNGIDGYVEVYTEKNGKITNITHWHPSEDEIYEDLFKINAGQLVCFKRKGFFSVGMFMADRKVWDSFSDRKKKRYTLIF